MLGQALIDNGNGCIRKMSHFYSVRFPIQHINLPVIYVNHFFAYSPDFPRSRPVARANKEISCQFSECVEIACISRVASSRERNLYLVLSNLGISKYGTGPLYNSN